MLQVPTPRTETVFGSAPDAPWSKIHFAPPDAWVERESYDATVPAREGVHVTHLCWSRQVHAGSGRSFHTTAMRLETGLAVQQESQWNVELDARTQRLTLHWLRVVRGTETIDNLHPERMRLLQRETQLERLVLDGRWTLLAVLDDVRPGDIVEAAYTYETQDTIRPGSCEAFFMVPPQAVVERYRLSVLWPAEVSVGKWRASSDAPERVEETLPDGGRRWSWTGAQTKPREEEFNVPANCMDHVWVQVSDLPDWPALASRVAEAWSAMDDVTGLADVPAFARPKRVGEKELLGLLTYFQTEFRYLSVDFQAGGWVPSAPAAVARRRHCDCKDISWLATAVLRSWGIEARPILVGTRFREKVGELLPMAALFNHAIIEVRWAGRTRWFDLTQRASGGRFDDRSVTWFGHGLPVDDTNNTLCAQPGRPTPAVYELLETILVDTRPGAMSLVEQRVRAEGWHADALRHAREIQGAELFFKEREQVSQRRFGRVVRAGEPRWRDDRRANVCEIVEVFEVPGCWVVDASRRRAIFDLPMSLVSMWFAFPENKARRQPWDLPYPCEVRHTMKVKAAGLTPGVRRRRRWDEPEFELTHEVTRTMGHWIASHRFCTRTPVVAAERVVDYRRHLETYYREEGLRLYLRAGRTRARRGYGFGELPEVEPVEPGEDDSHEELATDSPTPASAEGAGAAAVVAGSRRARRAAPRGEQPVAAGFSWDLIFALASLAGILYVLFRR